MADCDFLVIYFYALHEWLVSYCCSGQLAHASRCTLMHRRFGTSDSNYNRQQSLWDQWDEHCPINWWALLFLFEICQNCRHKFRTIFVDDALQTRHVSTRRSRSYHSYTKDKPSRWHTLEGRSCSNWLETPLREIATFWFSWRTIEQLSVFGRV